jgi:hypothetical protein
LSTTGAVPQFGATAAALSDGLALAGVAGLADVAGDAIAVDGAGDADGATVAPGAQALAMIASKARLVTRIRGPRTNPPRVNDPSRSVPDI